MQKIMLACLVIVAVVSTCSAIPSYNAAPVYNAGVSYGPQIHQIPVAIQSGYGSGAQVAAAPSTILYGAASNPSASSASAAAQSGLNAGPYTQIAVPSYELLAGEIVNPAGGIANIPSSYGARAY